MKIKIKISEVMKEIFKRFQWRYLSSSEVLRKVMDELAMKHAHEKILFTSGLFFVASDRLPKSVIRKIFLIRIFQFNRKRGHWALGIAESREYDDQNILSLLAFRVKAGKKLTNTTEIQEMIKRSSRLVLIEHRENYLKVGDDFLDKKIEEALLKYQTTTGGSRTQRYKPGLIDELTRLIPHLLNNSTKNSS